MEAFQNAEPDWLEDDDNFLADQPFDVTLRELIGVSGRTADDAINAIEWSAIIGGESSTGELVSRSRLPSAIISQRG